MARRRKRKASQAPGQSEAASRDRRVTPTGKTALRKVSRFLALILMAITCGVVIVVAIATFLPVAGEGESGDNGEQLATASPATADPVDDDPTRDGWDTEAFSQSAAEQLKILGKLLIGDKDYSQRPVVETKLRELMASRCRCVPLKRDALTEVYDTEGLVIRRMAAPSSSEPLTDVIEPLDGIEGGIDLLASVSQVFAGTAITDVELKVFRVQTGTEQWATDVIFHASGEGTQIAVQANGVLRCRWSPGGSDTPPKLQGMEFTEYEEVVQRGPEFVRFSDCTEAVLAAIDCFAQQMLPGLDDWIERTPKIFDRVRWGDQGLALGDVNGDGLDDVYICEPGVLPNRLFVHRADGSLADISAGCGADWLDHSRSALLIDLDNDGDQDLVVATSAALLIMENDGRANFTRRWSHAEVDAYSLSAADYDEDGLLDIYACCYNKQRYATDEIPLPIPYHDATNGGANALIRNLGNWTFQNVTGQCGLDADNHRWSLAAAWEDYDDDGDMDLYVANDFGRNCLYRNDDGRFINIAADAGVEDVGAGMSVTWGDYNHDGRMDLYVSNMFSTAGSRIAYQQQFKPEAAEQVRAAYQRLAKGNTLFQNAGDGTFADVSHQAAVARARWAWGASFVDINNDMWEDLIVTNGFMTREDARDL